MLRGKKTFVSWGPLMLLSVAPACIGEVGSEPQNTLMDASVPDGAVSIPDASVAATLDSGSDGGSQLVTDAGRDGGREGENDGGVISGGTPFMKEGFESSSLNTTAWKWVDDNASYALDTTRFHSGAASLRINTANINANPWNRGFVETTRTFPLAGRSLFIRAFIYLDDPAPTRHFTVLAARSAEKAPTAGDWSYKVNIVPTSSRLQWRYLWNYGTVGLGSFIDSAPADHADTGRWACWEWEIDGVDRQLRFWLDEAPLPNFTVTVGSQWAIAKNVHTQFGFQTSHHDSYGDAGYNVWVDDITVDDERVGCAH